jgi:long-chain-fatty-acid---luciferin-component ligase
VRQLPAVSLIDRVLFGKADPYRLSTTQREAFLLDAVREALQSHLERNDPLSDFFTRRQFTIEQIQNVSDLDLVPLLPTDVFKRARIVSSSPDSIVQSFTSSGTGGFHSILTRDEVTLQRFAGSLRSCTHLLEPWLAQEALDSRVRVVNLGPPRSADTGPWFSYVMSLIEVLAPTQHFVHNGELRLREALLSIRKHLRSGFQVGLVGPPAFVERLVRFAEHNNFSVDGAEQLFVLTGGGWKHFHHRALDPPDFRQLVMDAFGLNSTVQVRDGFNQVELNSVFTECEFHNKHVPPWVHAAVRDVNTLEAVAEGQAGLMSFLDATAHSFPCFIIGDDLGRLHSRCPCGRTGPIVEFIRRISRTSDEGCAMKMQATISTLTWEGLNPNRSLE